MVLLKANSFLSSTVVRKNLVYMVLTLGIKARTRTVILGSRKCRMSDQKAEAKFDLEKDRILKTAYSMEILNIHVLPDGIFSNNFQLVLTVGAQWL